MSYTTTHLALQGIIVWSLLSKKNREYYKKHRWEFVLINLFAILPDIDLFFGYHRTFTHSMVLPSFFLLSLLVVELYNKQTELFSSRGSRLIRFLKLATIMYMLHIFLDFSWDPILLFWPINTNLYDLTVYLRFETKPWLFFPLSFVGLIPNWEIYSLSEGRRLFFVNLSQQDQEAIFGNYLDLQISQITVHILLFIVWFVIILLPAFHRKKKKADKENRKSSKLLGTIWKRTKRQISLLGLFFILLGLLLGPIIGREREIQYDISSDYVNTLTFFDPTLGVGFEHKKSVTTEITFQSNTSFVSANFSFIILNNETQFYNFFTNFENITENYYDNNITYIEMLSQYDSEITNLLLDTYFYRKINEQTINEGATFILPSAEKTENFFLVTLVEEWNQSESFLYTVNLTINYIHNRRQAQIEGGILDGIGLVVILLDQLFAEQGVVFKKKKST